MDLNNDPVDHIDEKDLGEHIHALVRRLYPICRSITGDGLRKTLRIINSYAALEIREVPSGSRAYDWQIPREWNVRDAYIRDSLGNRVVDFKKNNLHLMGYSVPVNKKAKREELLGHLHTMPEHPDWIPYRYSYYKDDWGFCLSDNALKALNEPEYDVYIDSTLENGHLSYGEAYFPGTSSDEILFSAHACHPSLCNDNLSGLAIAAYLARTIGSKKHRYSYRFLFLPTTIGPLAWLSRNEDKLSRIKHGLVLACLGDAGISTYQESRIGNADTDRAMVVALRDSGTPFNVRPFTPYGYDQRQYCSPGFNLPVGCIMRSPNGCYPEYHTSADNLDFVQPAPLADSFSKILATINVLENDYKYLNLRPKGEPQLGRRGLFDKAAELGLMWILNYSDGHHSLLDIAEISGHRFTFLKEGADALVETGLIKQIS